jgi:hypothetical protein
VVAAAAIEVCGRPGDDAATTLAFANLTQIGVFDVELAMHCDGVATICHEPKTAPVHDLDE